MGILGKDRCPFRRCCFIIPDVYPSFDSLHLAFLRDPESSCMPREGTLKKDTHPHGVRWMFVLPGFDSDSDRRPFEEVAVWPERNKTHLTFLKIDMIDVSPDLRHPDFGL